MILVGWGECWEWKFNKKNYNLIVFYKQVPGDFHFLKRTRFRGLFCLSYLEIE